MKLTLGELADKLEELMQAKQNVDVARRALENRNPNDCPAYQAALKVEINIRDSLADEVIIDTDDEI